jgi:hypothetical protein
LAHVHVLFAQERQSSSAVEGLVLLVWASGQVLLRVVVLEAVAAYPARFAMAVVEV